MNTQRFKQLQQELQEQRKNAKKPLKLNEKVEEDVITSEYGKSEKPYNVFSPSQVGYCRRQMYNRKMNLTVIDRYIQGILHAGTVNHFWLEHHLPSLIDDRGLTTERKFRKMIELPENDFNLYVSGYADAVDSEGYVYDHKFTGDPSYKKKGPSTKDARQVMMYLYSLPDIHTGQLEYVVRDGKFSKNSNKPYIITHNVNFDVTEFKDTLEIMTEVAQAVKEREGTEEEIVNPFPRCERDGGDPCFYCQGDYKDFRKDVKEKLEKMNEWHKQVED